MTGVFFTDAEIKALVEEAKELPRDWEKKLRMRTKPSHDERDYDLTGRDGHDFRIMIRQNLRNQLDFSVGLFHRPAGSGTWFRLRRYNGLHEHTNAIERDKFYGCHIHQATERYQIEGHDEEGYAVQTTSYSNRDGALALMLNECGFQKAGPEQVPLAWQVE